MDAPRDILTAVFEAAVAAADPEAALAPALPDPPKGRTIVIGAGKGAAQLGRAFEKLWPGASDGVIVTRYGYAAACDRLEVMEAATRCRTRRASPAPKRSCPPSRASGRTISSSPSSPAGGRRFCPHRRGRSRSRTRPR